MKAQNGLKFTSELCFGIMNVIKDSYLLNSKSDQNAARICPFFYGESAKAAFVEINELKAS